MNALELADKCGLMIEDYGFAMEVRTMLRQQQAEIEALKEYVCDYRDEYVPFINWAANRKANNDTTD